MPKIRDQLTGQEINLDNAVMHINTRDGEITFTDISNPNTPPSSHAVLLADFKSPADVINMLSRLNDKPWFNPKKFFSAIGGLTEPGGFL